MSTTLIEKQVKGMNLEVIRFSGGINKPRIQIGIYSTGDGLNGLGWQFTKKEAIDFAITILQGATEFD